MCRGQIVPLARVGVHIEEIEVAPFLEQLPASGPYCPLLVGMPGPPKELPLSDWRPAIQAGQKVEPVELVTGRDRRARDGENRRRQIHRDGYLRRRPVRRKVAWPPEYQRDSYTPFP